MENPQMPVEFPPRKRSSVTRFMMPFRSSKPSSPRSSIDSTRSSLDVDYTDDKPRKLSKGVVTTRVQSVKTDASTRSNESNKLRKNSTTPVTKTTLSDVWERDRVTGEFKDHTNMLHSIAHEFDLPVAGGKLAIVETNTPARPASEVIKIFPPNIWTNILLNLDLADLAALSLSCKSFRDLVPGKPVEALNEPNSFRSRIDFLHRLDSSMPKHLLCYVCAKYHLRLNPGKETLRPANVANPVFDCPYSGSADRTKKFARHRITFGRTIPYPFLQLAIRHHHNGADYGFPVVDLGRRYKDRPEVGTWQHQTRWAVIDDHLYMRVVSTAFAMPNLPPAGLRHLLYSREDFVPFFSVCDHWRDGNLMPACKCALSHIPVPLSGSGVLRVGRELEQRYLKGPKSQIVTMCDVCRPLRRCPDCPSEYLIEIRLQEDRMEKDPTKLFKHAIVVTRWSDLGDGSAPWSPEWAAINGNTKRERPFASTIKERVNSTNEALPASTVKEEFDSTSEALPDASPPLIDPVIPVVAPMIEDPDAGKEPAFDSFAVLGRRAISGTFESFFNPEQIPPARLISMNPNMERLGEKGHNWY